MIDKIELWLNIFHYCMYKVDYRLHLLFNKLNPFLLLGRIPAIKKKFEERGMSQEKISNKLWSDKRSGFGVMISGGGLAIILFLFIWVIFLVVNRMVRYPIDFSWQPFVICFALSYAVCYFSVFQKDKYLKYFRRFEKWTRSDQRKYGLMSFAFIVGVVALWVYSFQYLPTPS